jgi:hypothetical protein
VESEVESVSDPKHPTKLVIVVKGGCVSEIYMDKPTHLRVFVADYDDRDTEETDSAGNRRALEEETAWLDSMQVRQIINKKGGTK